ncbi:MAG TPA: hypothetical protein VEI81_07955 [Methanoregula sp.]|nr:hypothetical protein [Methanoregula sp.]
MYETLFAVLMVIALGLIAGSALGLIIGFLAGTQMREWSKMDLRAKKINAALVAICSLAFIAVLAWYSLLR